MVKASGECKGLSGCWSPCLVGFGVSSSASGSDHGHWMFAELKGIQAFTVTIALCSSSVFKASAVQSIKATCLRQTCQGIALQCMGWSGNRGAVLQGGAMYCQTTEAQTPLPAASLAVSARIA